MADDDADVVCIYEVCNQSCFLRLISPREALGIV